MFFRSVGQAGRRRRPFTEIHWFQSIHLDCQHFFRTFHGHDDFDCFYVFLDTNWYGWSRVGLLPKIPFGHLSLLNTIRDYHSSKTFGGQRRSSFLLDRFRSGLAMVGRTSASPRSQYLLFLKSLLYHGTEYDPFLAWYLGENFYSRQTP